jgi:hypothetical protein
MASAPSCPSAPSPSLPRYNRARRCEPALIEAAHRFTHAPDTDQTNATNVVHVRYPLRIGAWPGFVRRREISSAGTKRSQNKSRQDAALKRRISRRYGGAEVSRSLGAAQMKSGERSEHPSRVPLNVGCDRFEPWIEARDHVGVVDADAPTVTPAHTFSVSADKRSARWMYMLSVSA